MLELARHGQIHRSTPVTDGIPQKISIGRNGSGHWATSALKECPPAFSRAIAGQFHIAIAAIPVDPDLDIDQQFLTVCAELMVSEYSSAIGRDYAG